MPKVTVRARALKDATTNFISIVDKGANRLPIRQLKSEKKSMFDINQLFSRKKAEPEANAVGIIVATDLANGYAAALKAEGHESVFILDCPNNDDTKCVSLKSELDLEPSEIVALNLGDRAVVIENGQKMLKDWGVDTESSFADNVAANGFYAGVRIASDTLASGIWDAMENSDPNTRPVDAVRDLLQGHMDYILGLVEAVPLSAFKMEAIQPVTEEAEHSTEESEADSATDDTPDTNGEPEQDGTVAEEATNTVTDDQPTTGDVAEETSAEATEDGEVEDGEPETGAKSENEPTLADVLAAVSGLTDTVNGLKSEVDTLNAASQQTGDALTVMTQQVSKAERTAANALEAANGTVVDTDEGTETIQKSEETHTRTFKHSNIESA